MLLMLSSLCANTAEYKEGFITYSLMGTSAYVSACDEEATGDISLSTLVIGSGVASIGARAFKWCPVASINIPDNVTTIGDDAFMLDSVKELVIGNDMTSIGMCAFQASDLKKIILLSLSIRVRSKI